MASHDCIVKASLFHQISLHQSESLPCSFQTQQMCQFLLIPFPCNNQMIYSLINMCVCVWEKRQEMLEEKEEKPGSLTVPVTWYPNRRSRLTSQDARKPEAPVTQTLPLNSILLSMPCLIDATFRSNYYRTVAFLVAC